MSDFYLYVYDLTKGMARQFSAMFLGNREKTQKGYYEFKTEYAYNTKAHTITIKQRGYKINEQSGKRVSINKIKKLNFDSYSLQF